MKKGPIEPIDPDDFNEDELYASYDAYKALLDAGVSKSQALSKTGLTPELLKDLEDEDEDSDFKDEFKEVWDDDSDEDALDDSKWTEEDIDDEFSDIDEDFDDGDAW